MPSVYGVTYVVRCCHAKGWWHAKGEWMLRKSTHAMPPTANPNCVCPDATVPSLCQACTHPSLPPSVPRTAYHIPRTAYRVPHLSNHATCRHPFPPTHPTPPLACHSVARLSHPSLLCVRPCQHTAPPLACPAARRPAACHLWRCTRPQHATPTECHRIPLARMPA